MCGIAGFWGEIAQTPGALAQLERMTAALSHRGSDRQSCWLVIDVGLPVRFKVAANGEIKMLSRRIVEQLLPPDIATKPK
jgi:asparagine synthetase B (glutamine-hydrolysing)